jgi:hypothetical protein
MRNLRIYITIVLMVAWFQGVSQKVEAWASVDSAAIMIGDQIGMELGINVPENSQVQWPMIADTIMQNIEVVTRGEVDTLFDSGRMIMKQRLTVTSFDSGYFEVPPFDFLYILKDDTTVYNTESGSFYLQVYVPEVDTAQPFKVIKGPIEEPYTFGEILPWILIGLVVLAALVFLVFWLRKRKKNQPLFKAKPKPLLPPDVEAINKLEEIRLARVWQSGKVKQYFSSLTDVMKVYLKRRYGFDAPEMTSDEIIDVLSNHSVNPGAMEKLQGMMQLADLVKFAKAQPTPLENDLSLNHCIDFVNETKPVVIKDEEKTELSDQKEVK